MHRHSHNYFARNGYMTAFFYNFPTEPLQESLSSYGIAPRKWEPPDPQGNYPRVPSSLLFPARASAEAPLDFRG